MAFLFLFLIVLLMLFATLGVKDFGDELFHEANITIHPIGKRVEL